MNMTQDFTNIRLQNKKYTKELSGSSLRRYLHEEGWIDTAVDKELIFSHRNTWYQPETFKEKFHIHEYYEVIFYIKGNVEYLNENLLVSPSPNMVIWFKPGQLHTARILAPTQYERYVLYLSPDFFNLDNKVTPMTDFMTYSNGTHMTLPEKTFGNLLKILKKAENIAGSGKPYTELVLKSLLIELFYILDFQRTKIQKGEAFSESIGEVKRYIDANYATISSISDIADHFFYSREHLSRKFMKSFNISIAHYLSRRRITESLALLEDMSMAEVAYAVGFHSQSAFISAFKKSMHCLPSEYKAKYKQESVVK